MTKISANILRSFPVEVTPYLDLISYLYPRLDSHHCPFTIMLLTTKARSSLAIKHHKCCCTNPPTCSNLVSVTFYEHLKYELFGGSLSSRTACVPPEAEPRRNEQPCPSPGIPKRSPGPLLSLAPGASPSTHRSGDAPGQTCSHWNHSETQPNSVEMST